MARKITVTVTEEHVREAQQLESEGWDVSLCCPNALAILDALGLPHLVATDDVAYEGGTIQDAVEVGTLGIDFAVSPTSTPHHLHAPHPPASKRLVDWYDHRASARQERPTFPVVYELEVPV